MAGVELLPCRAVVVGERVQVKLKAIDASGKRPDWSARVEVADVAGAAGHPAAGPVCSADLPGSPPPRPRPTDMVHLVRQQKTYYVGPDGKRVPKGTSWARKVRE